jgi:tRNA U34 2-thiouridine synthase MnmA/TrmU
MSQEDPKCQAQLDLEDAMKVAEQLNIPLIEVNFVKEY